MDKKTKTKSYAFSGIKAMVAREVQRRRTSKTMILVDVGAFALALFFARRHIALGAYPMALSLLAVLPTHVLIALLGAVVGSLTLGTGGVILAVSSVLVVMFRLVSSLIAGERGGLFREASAMRVGAAALGGAVGAAYEMISGSFSPSSMIFASAQILLTVGICMVLLGVFTYDVTVGELLSSHAVFTVRREGREKIGFLVFLLSLLSFIVRITVSLEGYDLFGISLAYLFVGGVTLLTARRFGAVKAMAVGFFSAVGINPVAAVGFALAGLVSGFLFEVGITYGLIGGVAAISAWCAYSGGMTLFLSAVPEWSIMSTLMIPYLRTASKERVEEMRTSSVVDSEAAIRENLYRIKGGSSGDGMSEKIRRSAQIIREYFGSTRGEIEEYRNAVIAATSHLTPTPCDENIDKIASILYTKGCIFESEVAKILDINYGGAAVAATLNLAVRGYEGEIYGRGGRIVADEMESVSRLCESHAARERESLTTDGVMAERVLEKARLLGLSDAVATVIGARKRRVILAALDDGTDRIERPDVLRLLGEALGCRLGAPSYKKSGNTAVLEAEELARFGYEVGVASRPSHNSASSGDSTCFFERNGVLFAVLSDGMGTGETAMRTSRLVCEYLSESAESSEDIEILISAINGIVLASGTECCATVDVFYLDLFTGDGGFFKAGAVSSFLKKGDSVRRIRAKSAPVGAMETVDAVGCVCDVTVGDYIIMMSDGVAEIPEETVWLLDLVSGATDIGAEEMAKKIITLAEKSGRGTDDMSVMVLRITKQR